VTRKRRILLLTFTVLFITSVCYYFYAQRKCAVQVDCLYIRYACGDCYPRYNVRRVISRGCNLKLLNEDISLEFNNDDLSNRFDRETPVNIVSPAYFLEGHIHYSIWKRHYILTVSNFTYIKKDSSYYETIPPYDFD